ncbi:MAG: Hsp20/alpha crystallin family protein [Acidobacteriota bacterium]
MVRIRKNPALQLAELHRRMERMMDHLLHGVGATSEREEWMPRVDIYETSERLIVTMELPGVSRDGIEILVEGPYLRVSGVRDEPMPQGCVRMHHMEIAYGPFERVVALPRDIDAERVSATYRDGFLMIEIPSDLPAGKSVPISDR